MKYFLLIAISIAALFIACTNSNQELSERGKKMGFDITAPKGWEKKDTTILGLEIIFVRSPFEDANDKFQENLLVYPNDMDSTSQTDYIDNTVENEKAGLSNFELYSRGIRKINGEDINYITYTHLFNGIKLEMTSHYFFSKNKVYHISQTSEFENAAKWNPVFEKVVRSFRLTGK